MTESRAKSAFVVAFDQQKRPSSVESHSAAARGERPMASDPPPGDGRDRAVSLTENSSDARADRNCGPQLLSY